jgi:hypothetical protein
MPRSIVCFLHSGCYDYYFFFFFECVDVRGHDVCSLALAHYLADARQHFESSISILKSTDEEQTKVQTL